MSEFLTCPRCGYTGAAYATCWGCLFERPCETPERCGTPRVHTCPAPMDPEAAQFLAWHSSPSRPLIVSARDRARIQLALRGDSDN